MSMEAEPEELSVSVRGGHAIVLPRTHWAVSTLARTQYGLCATLLHFLHGLCATLQHFLHWVCGVFALPSEVYVYLCHCSIRSLVVRLLSVKALILENVVKRRRNISTGDACDIRTHAGKSQWIINLIREAICKARQTKQSLNYN